jgi:BirA family biotin operon repressor/biotin-[acetyl-CoA-carboxylase] ligase
VESVACPPVMGFSTAPLVLWERFVPSRQIGRHVLCYKQLDSTMSQAWNLVNNGAIHGTAVVALEQTQGHGRLGRSWISEPGHSLTTSVILHTNALVAAKLSMVSGLAVVQAVHRLTGTHCTIKWPNDVRIATKKVCGILPEVRVDTEGTAVAVVGFGLNLSLDTNQYPEIRDNAVSLQAATGYDIKMSAAADALLEALDELHTGAIGGRDVLGEWRGTLDTLGSRVTARFRSGEETGMAEGVADDGSLLLRRPDGTLMKLASGEVTLHG